MMSHITTRTTRTTRKTIENVNVNVAWTFLDGRQQGALTFGFNSSQAHTSDTSDNRHPSAFISESIPILL